MSRSSRRRMRFTHIFSALLLAVVLQSSLSSALPGSITTTQAATALPAWQITTLITPTDIPPGPGRLGKYAVVIENVGGAPSNGGLTIKDTLPQGVTATTIRAEPGTCNPQIGREIVCHISEAIVPSGFIAVNIYFEMTGEDGPRTVTDVASVSGGGAPPAVAETRTQVLAKPETTSAGVDLFNFDSTGLLGEPTTQAGGHPNLATTTAIFNSIYAENVAKNSKPVQAVKDLLFYLPLGFLGNPTIAATCPITDVEPEAEKTDCPPSSRLGTVLPMILNGVRASSPDPTHGIGIYNLPAENGYAAEFAFGDNTFTFVLYANVVRHDGAYMLRIAIPGIPPGAGLVGAITSFYGDIQEHYLGNTPEELRTFDRGPFLTDPSDCAEGEQAREASVEANTWENPGVELTATANAFPKLKGCQLQRLSAELTVTPENSQAQAPSGYEVGLDIPQQPNVSSAIATPPLKDVSVTLPEGATISPPSANGLETCQELGPHGINIEGPESEALAEDGLPQPVAGHCPPASEIGTARASTPLLQEELSGHMYLATPQCGGEGQEECTPQDAEDGHLFRLYLELANPKRGVYLKLAGHASVNAQTGRVTATFEDQPQFPVSEINIALKRGPRAPLANPQTCGAATSEGNIDSWSPQTPAVHPASVFNVDWVGAGGACPASEPFAPRLEAFATNPVAGATGPLSFTLTRADREQDIESLSATLPQGLLAYISKIARCSEPQASEAALGACPAGSQIGTATVAVGSGAEPYYVTGKVYLTEGYEGAPFGLSILVPAVAGPFNLGDVLVRARLTVDPHTAQVTAETGPLPQILDGVPLHYRTLNVTVNTPEFVLNPTSCATQAITARVASSAGATASLSNPFTTTGCENLGFKPALNVATEAQATKLGGTGVKLTITSPTSGEANLHELQLSFPKELPVRLSTLHMACPAATFEGNPAACPSASDVGTATVHTPILGQPLSGPAYLVSYGSAQFPDVVFVLQGEGVAIDLDTKSSVSSSGVLTTTATAIPDAPVSTFEADFPHGPYSVFTSSHAISQAQASQCGENLTATLQMIGQNGAKTSASPALQIAGCKPARPAVKVIHASAHGAELELTVKTSVRGRLSISGSSVHKLVQALGPGTHQLTVHLTTAGRTAARDHRKTTLSLQLTVGKQRAHAHRRIAL